MQFIQLPLFDDSEITGTGQPALRPIAVAVETDSDQAPTFQAEQLPFADDTADAA